MSLGESFGAQVIKAAPAGAAVQPQPKADALQPKEDLNLGVIPRPQLKSPYEKRRP